MQQSLWSNYLCRLCSEAWFAKALEACRNIFSSHSSRLVCWAPGDIYKVGGGNFLALLSPPSPPESFAFLQPEWWQFAIIKAASSIWIRSRLGDWCINHISWYPLSVYDKNRNNGLLVTPILKIQIWVPIFSLKLCTNPLHRDKILPHVWPSPALTEKQLTKPNGLVTFQSKLEASNVLPYICKAFWFSLDGSGWREGM